MPARLSSPQKRTEGSGDAGGTLKASLPAKLAIWQFSLSIGNCHLAVAVFCRLANSRKMANRIREMRKSRGKTLEELSGETGISTSYLSRIEKGEGAKDGRGLSLENAVRIARALGCEVTDFTSDFSDEDIEAALRLPLSDKAPDGDVPNLTIHAGLGNGGLLSAEISENGVVLSRFTDGYWNFPDSVRSGFRQIGKTHALPVKGDSMEPTLVGGSVVFVDTSHVMPSPPDLYAVDYGDGLMIKRIELIPRSSRVRVISDNDRYQTHEMDREELLVYGRVVASFQWRG